MNTNEWRITHCSLIAKIKCLGHLNLWSSCFHYSLSKQDKYNIKCIKIKWKNRVVLMFVII